MTVLQSFPPEICSLICQDPILERLDLNSICYISHAFRNEAQRELSYHFPFLRGARSAKFWSHSLSPHAAKGIKGLVLLLPSDFDIILNFILSLYMCVNLKELVVLFEPSSSTHIMSQMFPMFPPIIQLTKLVNGYFSQDNQGNSTFIALLRSQRNLELLELHSGEIGVFKSQLSLDCLKTLGCPPQFLDTSYSLTRLRLNFGNSSDNCEIDILGRVLHRNLTRNMKSFKLAIFFNQEQSRFPEIIRAVAESHIYIQHLKIHQFLPTQDKKDLPLPVNSYGRNIRTLVFRPPPGLPKTAGDNPNLCAYVELRTSIGRRKVAEKLIMRTLPTLTRLVLVVHGTCYNQGKIKLPGTHGNGLW